MILAVQNNPQSMGSVESYRQRFHDKIRHSSKWIAFKAFRRGDIRLCHEAKDERNCMAFVKTITTMKNLASGNCANLKDVNGNSMEGLCNALKTNSCANLSSYQKDLCLGLAQKDINLVRRAFVNPELPDIVPYIDQQAEYSLGLYAGFQSGKEISCQRALVTNNALNRSSCNMLFGDGSAQNKLSSIAEDYAYLFLAKQNNNKEHCRSIKDNGFKNVCLNDAIPLFQIDAHVWE